MSCGLIFGRCTNFAFYVLFTLFPCHVNLLRNGIALTPPMGWMSWGYYKCSVDCDKYPDMCLNENLVLSVADVFYHEGYQEAGYEYIIIDDCWSEKERDTNGNLVPDQKRFPNGMRYVADYIHTRGLKFGMYTNIASVTCMHYPGSKGYFEKDARQFLEWGIDYLKVDGCFVNKENLNNDYIKLGKELNKYKNIVYSCSWPYYIQFIIKEEPNYDVIKQHCNMWRNFHDVFFDAKFLDAVIEFYTVEYAKISQHHGPGHWNDPDMVMVGNNVANLDKGERRINLVVYMMWSAPILLSCNMETISSEEKALLQNLDLVAIGQDVLGIMAQPYQLRFKVTLWVKPRLPKKGNMYISYSFAFVNLGQTKQKVQFFPSHYGLDSNDGYAVMDVLANDFPRNVTLDESFYVTIPPRDVILYTLFPL